jgi:hypothetical protein
VANPSFIGEINKSMRQARKDGSRFRGASIVLKFHCQLSRFSSNLTKGPSVTRSDRFTFANARVETGLYHGAGRRWGRKVVYWSGHASLAEDKVISLVRVFNFLRHENPEFCTEQWRFYCNIVSGACYQSQLTQIEPFSRL